jgi:hypothetical protein
MTCAFVQIFKKSSRACSGKLVTFATVESLSASSPLVQLKPSEGPLSALTRVVEVLTRVMEARALKHGRRAGRLPDGQRRVVTAQKPARMPRFHRREKPRKEKDAPGYSFRDDFAFDGEMWRQGPRQGAVEITASSVSGTDCLWNAAYLGDNNSWFCSEQKWGRWICFDFKTLRIELKHDTIMAHNLKSRARTMGLPGLKSAGARAAAVSRISCL